MTSSSPHCGHGVAGQLAPSSQNAGQSPCPAGILMRASTRPCMTLNVPRVVIFAEV
jgi:hypothetical protein